MDWTALKDLIVVAESGSLSAAARRTGTSQPTLGRRMEQLERDLGNVLFTRSSRGLALTPGGEKILALAKQMQDEADAIALVATGTSQALEGRVRVTLTDTMGNRWLPAKLPAFYRQYPGLRLDIVVDNRSLDLLKREADIAVRFFRPQQLDLVVRHVGEYGYGLYASHAYLQEHGSARSVRELRNHNFISYDESIYQLDSLKRIEQLFGAERVIHRSTSILGILEAIKQGLGMGVTGCSLADDDPGLVRIMPDKFRHSFPVWVVTHEEIYKSARIRAVFDFLCENLSADGNSFSGNEN